MADIQQLHAKAASLTGREVLDREIPACLHNL
jgi:hypothetical protein